MITTLIGLGSKNRQLADNLLPDLIGLKRPFLSEQLTPPKINCLAVTKTPGKTFAVLAGFCPSNSKCGKVCNAGSGHRLFALCWRSVEFNESDAYLINLRRIDMQRSKTEKAKIGINDKGASLERDVLTALSMIEMQLSSGQFKQDNFGRLDNRSARMLNRFFTPLSRLKKKSEARYNSFFASLPLERCKAIENCVDLKRKHEAGKIEGRNAWRSDTRTYEIVAKKGRTVSLADLDKMVSEIDNAQKTSLELIERMKQGLEDDK